MQLLSTSGPTKSSSDVNVTSVIVAPSPVLINVLLLSIFVFIDSSVTRLIAWRASSIEAPWIYHFILHIWSSSIVTEELSTLYVSVELLMFIIELLSVVFTLVVCWDESIAVFEFTLVFDCTALFVLLVVVLVVSLLISVVLCAVLLVSTFVTFCVVLSSLPTAACSTIR